MQEIIFPHAFMMLFLLHLYNFLAGSLFDKGAELIHACILQGILLEYLGIAFIQHDYEEIPILSQCGDSGVVPGRTALCCDQLIFVRRKYHCGLLPSHNLTSLGKIGIDCIIKNNRQDQRRNNDPVQYIPECHLQGCTAVCQNKKQQTKMYPFCLR